MEVTFYADLSDRVCLEKFFFHESKYINIDSFEVPPPILHFNIVVIQIEPLASWNTHLRYFVLSVCITVINRNYNYYQKLVYMYHI